MHIRKLFLQLVVALGFIPLRFIVQCGLIYKCFPLITGAVFTGGFCEAAGVTAILWIIITLIRFLQIPLYIARKRILIAINPEAAELGQLKLFRQREETQKKILTQLSNPVSLGAIASQLKLAWHWLFSTIIGIALASLFLTQVFINRTPISVIECALLIIASDFMVSLLQLLLFRTRPISKVASKDSAGATQGRVAAVAAGLQELDDVMKTAEVRFQLELQNNPGPSAYNDRGKHYLSFHKFIDAIDDFSQAISLSKDFAEGYENRAGAYAGMKLPWLAQKDLQEAGRLYTEQGREADCRRTLDKLGDLSGISAISIAGVRESLMGLAFCFDPNKLNALKEMELKHINRDLGKNTQTANMYCKKAELLLRQRQFAEAVLACDKAIAANNEIAAAYRIRAEIKIQQSKIYEALNDYDKAIKLNENDGEACLGRARLYFYVLGNPEAALKDCTHAMSFSLSRQLQLLRGKIFIALDRYELAISDLSEAIQSWERFSALWDAFLLPVFRSIANGLRVELMDAYKQRANAYDKLGQLDKSAQDLARAENLKKIIKSGPNFINKPS